MQIDAKILLLSLGLVSCGTATDSRYRDTAMLERPPALAVSHQAGEPSRTSDESMAQKNRDGEESDTVVYMSATEPSLLVIKQPYDLAWDTLGHALKQDFLKVTERNRDKGLYYVTYDREAQAEKEGGFFDKALSLLQDKFNEEHYVLTVTAKGEETQISAAINNETKTNAASAKDSGATPAADGAEKLLLSIYKTMSDKPQKEKEEKEQKTSKRRHKD